MIHGIRQKAVVGQGGKIEIFSPELPKDSTVEVIILIESSEEDTTEYLLSTEANRKHLFQAIDNIEKNKYLTVITPEEWNEKYCI